MSDVNELVNTALKEITQILAKLETDTGRVVIRLAVEDGGIMEFNDKGELRRCVVIKLGIPPGSGWD